MNSSQTKAGNFTATSLADIAKHGEEMALRAEDFARRCQTQTQSRYEEGRAAALYEMARVLRSTVLVGPPPPVAAPALQCSPAIGEFAALRLGRVQAEHAEMYKALKKLVDALDSGSTTVPHHALHARDVLRRVGASLSDAERRAAR